MYGFAPRSDFQGNNCLTECFVFLMTCLIYKTSVVVVVVWRGGIYVHYSPTNSLSRFCLQFLSFWFNYLIKYCKTKEKQSRSFILCFAYLITALTHHGQTHTNAQMSPAGGTFQNIWRDKK